MAHVYRFDDVEIDLRNFRARKSGKPLPLEPKAFTVLVFLVEHRGRLIEKRELIDAVWGDSFVTENVLTRSVAQLRKALEDGAQSRRCIETVPTRGYRFIAEVTAEEISDGGTGQPLHGKATKSPGEATAPEASPPRAKSRRQWILAGVAIAVFVALAVPLALRHQATPKAGNALGFATNQQFSSGDGLDINACFSPDGNLVAYASDRTGSFEIYVRSLETGSRELQLTNNGNQNMFPSFSPDGRSVAFSSASKPGIFRVAAIGGPIQRLTDLGVQPAWSPDGRLIVFRSQPSATLATTDYYYPPVFESTLWLVPSEGGAPRQITNSSAPEGGQNFPSWSPDGETIRFVNYFDFNVSLWTYRLRDGSLQKRFEWRAGATVGSAIFSRDSSRVYFVTSQLNGNIGISQLKLNPDTLEPEAEEQPLYTPSVGVPRDLSLSPDGKHLAYSAILSESKLLVMGMAGDEGDGSEPFLVTRDVSFRYMEPEWSPDGKKVVFVQIRKSQPAQAYIAGLDGSSSIPVSPGTFSQYYPQFSADGKEAIYMQVGPVRSIKATRLADGATRTLSEIPANVQQPETSPDGSEVVYSDAGAAMHSGKLDLRTGVRSQLTFGSDPSAFPRFSRDGKWLAVQVMKGPNDVIALMPSAGGKLTPIWTEPGQWFTRNWSPDDSKILMAGNPGGGWALYWISRDGKRSKQITKTLPLRMYVRYPDWSPDGKKIVYEFNESKGNVFLAELK